MQLHENPKVRY